MNSIAFSTVVPEGEAGRERLALIANAGFDGVEPTFAPEATWPSVADPHAGAAALKREADALGLAVPSMRGGPCFWPTFAAADRAERDQAVDLAKAALDAVAEMGADTLLIVPGKWDAPQRYEEIWAHAAETAQRVGELAEARGLTIALENVENEFLLSPAEWAAFLREVKSPALGMYFDVGNVVANRQGHPQRWLDELGTTLVRRIHFKDAPRGGGTTYLLEGDVDWTAVAEAIARADYRDWVGVELNLPAHRPAAMLEGTAAAARAILEPTDGPQ